MIEFPNDATGQTLKFFRERGIDLSKPVVIEFCILSPDQKNGEAIALEVRQLGFITTLEYDKETSTWTCFCKIRVLPEYANIVKIERELGEISQSFGAQCDGFGWSAEGSYRNEV